MNTSFAKAVFPGMISNEEMSAKEKLSKIKAKLRSGARLTAEEKEYLRTSDPQFYAKITALEREEAAYEARLKNCRTRDDAEQAKTEKLGQIAADLKVVDPEYSLLRLTWMRDVENRTAATILRKPWSWELDQKRREERKRLQKKEDEKIRKRKAQQRRRDEAVRKEKINKKIRQEKAMKQEWIAEQVEEEEVQRIMEEETVMERLEEEEIASELMNGRAIVEEQIAKFMIAAGMMDLQATKLQASESPELPSDTASTPPSLGSSTGYAAYRAAAYMPELAVQEEEKKPYVRRA